MVPLDLSSWLGEYWWVWLSVVTVALYIFGVQLSHGVLFAARLFAILRGCPSTLRTTVVAKNRALVRDPKLFSGTSNQFKEWVFSVELALRANAVRPGAHEVDYAMSFLDGNARLWLLSCLERGHNFPDWVSLKSALAETFGPVEAEEEFRLALFSLCQTDSMSLEEYVSECTRLSLGIPDLDERSRALLFTRGLSNHLNSEVMREHPRTLSDAIRAARVARMNLQLFNISRGSNRMAARTARVSTGGTMAGTPTEPNEIQSKFRPATRTLRKKLTDSERAQLMKEGRCFKCRAFGHLVKNCPEVLPNDIRQ